MILSGVGKRYAVALFNVATKEEIAEQVNGDIVSFAAVFAKNAGFRNFLMSPMVLTDDKKDFVRKVIGERASGLFLQFVTLLIDKKRLAKIDEIAEAYTFLYEQSMDIVEVKAVTAVPMDTNLETQTKKRLQGIVGREVRLVTKIDPNIIGGMVLVARDKIIDGSIRYRLAQIRKALSAVRVS